MALTDGRVVHLSSRTDLQRQNWDQLQTYVKKVAALFSTHQSVGMESATVLMSDAFDSLLASGLLWLISG